MLDKEYTFALTEREANIILNALAQRPYVEVVDLIAKIHAQAAKQTDDAD